MDDAFPVLAVVAMEPVHPFAVLEHLNMLGVKSARSTLYRRVDSLIEQGFMVDQRRESGRSRSQRSLVLTASGEQRLVAAVTNALRNEGLESPYFALALNCSRMLPRNEVCDILRIRMAGAARLLTVEEQQLRESPGKSWETAGRSRHIAHLRADIEWLQGLLRSA